MLTAEQFRAKRTEYAELLMKTDIPSEIREDDAPQGETGGLARDPGWQPVSDKIVANK